MSFAKVHGAQTTFLKSNIVDIEVDISKGLHSFSIVGLPDRATEEAADRVSAAIKNSGFIAPKSQNKKIIVSLAPADIRKEGTHYDLAIALAYLLAEKLVSFDPQDKIFLGELSLNGLVRPIHGVLPLTLEAKLKGFKTLFVPKENAEEAALVDGIEIYGVTSLKELIEHLDQKHIHTIPIQGKTTISTASDFENDFSEVVGQEASKRALEIAAAGGHNIAMYGPPGTGKTMLAKAFNSILPSLSFDEILEVTSIYSIAGILNKKLITTPPFRAPHHTSSHIALVGGGTIPKPGEITLAHKGVLFLDEFPEFDKKVLESLRQPLEEKIVQISRARGSGIFPAHFLLVAAMNPCPCGNFGIENKHCVCSAYTVTKYQKKISGPIMDRIDIWTEVSKINHKELGIQNHKTESSSDIKIRIKKVREIQEERFRTQGIPIKINSEMRPKHILEVAHLNLDARNILNIAAEKLNISARAYHKLIKVSRTIADLDASIEIQKEHILEAIQYRPKHTQVI